MRRGFVGYRRKSEPVLINVSLGIGLVLLLTEVVPCLASIVDSQAPVRPVCGFMGGVSGYMHCGEESEYEGYERCRKNEWMNETVKIV